MGWSETRKSPCSLIWEENERRRGTSSTLRSSRRKLRKIRRKTFSRGHRGLFFIGIRVLRSLSECSRGFKCREKETVWEIFDDDDLGALKKKVVQVEKGE